MNRNALALLVLLALGSAGAAAGPLDRQEMEPVGGPGDTMLRVPGVIGMHPEQAKGLLQQAGLNPMLKVETRRDSKLVGKEGTVIRQIPLPGGVAMLGSSVSLTSYEPDTPRSSPAPHRDDDHQPSGAPEKQPSNWPSATPTAHDAGLHRPPPGRAVRPGDTRTVQPQARVPSGSRSPTPEASRPSVSLHRPGVDPGSGTPLPKPSPAVPTDKAVEDGKVQPPARSAASTEGSAGTNSTVLPSARIAETGLVAKQPIPGASLVSPAAAPASPAPQQPVTGFTARAVDPDQIHLSWDAVPGASEYILARLAEEKMVPGNWEYPIPPVKGTSFVDSGLKRGRYYYTIFPVYAQGAYKTNSPHADAGVVGIQQAKTPRVHGPLAVDGRSETRTRIQIRKDSVVRVRASGKINFGGGIWGVGDAVRNADGDDLWGIQGPDYAYPDPKRRKNSLLCDLVTDNGTRRNYQCGVDTRFTADRDGTLLLLANDGYRSDNTGTWSVTVEVTDP